MVSLLLFVFLQAQAANAEFKNFPICNSVKAKLGEADAEATQLKKKREVLGTAVAAATPVPCGKDKPMPAVHAQVLDYAKAMHAMAVKVRRAAAEKNLKGTKADACKKELEAFLTEQEADQRKLYEKVEALCR